MADNFDAYLKWLAIPPEEQPPNHYRLLGVSQFTDDADVIANAADRQMRHVRTFSSGRHADLSQKILNELSTARVCLLNPQDRSAYDVQLREQLNKTASASGIAKAAPPRPGPPPPRPSGPAASAPMIDTHKKRVATEFTRHSSRLPLAIMAVAAAALLVALLTTVYLVSRRGDDDEDPLISRSDGSTPAERDTSKIQTSETARGKGRTETNSRTKKDRPTPKKLPRKTLPDQDSMQTMLDLADVDEPWARDWSVLASAPGLQYEHSFNEFRGDRPNPGRTGILMIHPSDRKVPAVVARYAKIDGPAPVLRMGLSGNVERMSSWNVVVLVDGKPLDRQRSIRALDGWQDVTYDLSPYAGQTVFISVQAHARGFHWKHAFIDYIEIAQKDDKPPVDLPPDGDPKDDPNGGKVEPPPVAAKGSVPSDDDQQQARQKLDTTLTDNAPQDLVKLAQERSENDAEKYVLFLTALDKVADEGDLQEALRIVDTLNASYDLDIVALKAQAIRKLVGSTAAEQQDAVCRAAIELSEQAQQQGNTELAQQLAKDALAAARKSKDVGLIRQATLNLLNLKQND